MRYVKAKAKKEAEEKTYRIYLSDGIKMISENTAKYAGGTSFKKRYFDLIRAEQEETRNSDEIIDSIRKKLQGME